MENLNGDNSSRRPKYGEDARKLRRLNILDYFKCKTREFNELIERFSDLSKLIRVMAS